MAEEKKALTVSQMGVQRLKLMLSNEETKQRFNEMLGKKSAGFISSIITAARNNKMLAECDPASIISSAAIAASLDLPINANLGLAALVPYREKGGMAQAQFQIMRNGYVNLAIRSGQYKTMNTAEVRAGMIKSRNPISGEIEWNEEWSESGDVVGYVAYTKMLNGFEKYLYMTTEQVKAHATRYSKSYQKGYGPWKDNFSAMAQKTVIKLLLSKWGLLSVDIQNAVQADQATSVVEGEYEYLDSADVIDAEPQVTEAPKEERKTRAHKAVEASHPPSTEAEIEASVQSAVEATPETK